MRIQSLTASSVGFFDAESSERTKRDVIRDMGGNKKGTKDQDLWLEFGCFRGERGASERLPDSRAAVGQ